MRETVRINRLKSHTSFLTLLISPSSDRLGMAFKSLLFLNQNQVSFCLNFRYSTLWSSIWISTSFIHWWESVERVFRGGWERVQWGLPILTLTEPSLNPHWTLTEPSLNPEQIQIEFQRFRILKSAGISWNFTSIIKIQLSF